MLQIQKTEFAGLSLSKNISNPVKSVACMSRLSSCIFNGIFSERNLMPDNCFVEKQIEGIPVKEFHPVTRNKLMGDVKTWMAELHNVLNLKLVKTATMILINKEKDKEIESYTIKYTFIDAKTPKLISEFQTSSGIKNLLKNFKNILRTTDIELPSLDNLKVKFKINFNNFEGYYPLHINDYIMQSSECLKLEQNILEIGAVRTPFNKMKFGYIAGNLVDDDAVVAVDDVQDVPDIIEVPDSEDDEETPIIELEAISQTPTPIDINPSEVTSSLDAISNIEINCICKTDICNSFVTLMKCKNCLSYQHAECFGIYKAKNIPKEHLCPNCSFVKATEEPGPDYISTQKSLSTDKRLLGFTNKENKQIGLIRLVLIYMFRNNKNPTEFLKSNFKPFDFHNTMKKLKDYNLIEKENGRWIPNKTRVQKFCSKHFIIENCINNYF